MGDLVNLRRARKAKAKSAADQKAEENRRRFGLSSGEKNLRDAEALIENRRFAGHRLAEKPSLDDTIENGR